MHSLYSLIEFVLIIAFFALIIGLIRPTIVIRWGEKRTRGKVLLYYGLGMIFLSIISGLIKPEEIKEQERQQRVERLQKEQEQKEQERQQQLQQAQPILEKAKQQLNSARNAYTSGKFKNAITSAQKATNTLKSISHVPEASSLDNQAMSLITDATEALANAPDYILSVNQLYREYQNNEVAADIKYKGKIVLISGTIHDISKDILGKPFIVIGGSGFFDGAQCSFTRNQESVLGRLSKGQHVKIKGKVSGKFGHVQVEDCTLQ